MTAVEISNMSLEEKATKAFEIIQNNIEANQWFAKYVTLIGTNGFTPDNFYGMFLAKWTN